jgi:hypothetical protein
VEFTTIFLHHGAEGLKGRLERQFYLAFAVYTSYTLYKSNPYLTVVRIDFGIHKEFRPAPQLVEGAQRSVETGGESPWVGDANVGRVVRPTNPNSRLLEYLKGAE